MSGHRIQQGRGFTEFAFRFGRLPSWRHSARGEDPPDHRVRRSARPNESSETSSLLVDNTRTHIVKPGEFLSTIVRREYQMSYESLWPLIRALDPSLKDPNRVLARQQTKLPVLPAG